MWCKNIAYNELLLNPQIKWDKGGADQSVAALAQTGWSILINFRVLYSNWSGVILILKENSQKAVINAIEKILQKSVPLDVLLMPKLIQKFQETCIASACSTRPVNLNKTIPNAFKMISTQAHA